MMPLISIAGLCVRFPTRSECVRAVDTIDLEIARGDHIALIGESGCGKTVLGMAVMGLLPENARIRGTIRYRERDLLQTEDADMQRIRGKEIAMIMQNSANTLNPVITVGSQVAEPILIHGIRPAQAAHAETIRLLAAMGFDEPERTAGRYPHEFSGGMRERILVAIALACQPDIVIADEPTSGLDAEVKSQILHLIKKQMADRTLLLITHDMGTAHFLCTRIAVMYAGEIVEEGPTHDILSLPMHPYTQGLLSSLPSAGLHPIPGMSPSPAHLPEGCRFCLRCPSATSRCCTEHPPMRVRRSRRVRCFHYD
jgi:peptide/nickel transport system ATP-binding protein